MSAATAAASIYLLSIHLQSELDRSPAAAGMALVPQAVATVAGGLLAPWVALRIGRPAAIVTALVLQALGLAALGITPTASLLPLVLVGLGFGFIGTLATTTLLDSSPRSSAGQVGAIQEIAFALGSGAGVAVFATIALVGDPHGFALALTAALSSPPVPVSSRSHPVRAEHPDSTSPTDGTPPNDSARPEDGAPPTGVAATPRGEPRKSRGAESSSTRRLVARCPQSRPSDGHRGGPMTPAAKPRPRDLRRSRGTVAHGFTPATSDSEEGDGFRLGTLLTFSDLELNLLALFEGAVAVHLDRAPVDEHVLAVAFEGDESVALFGVEPLDGALCHYFSIECSVI